VKPINFNSQRGEGGDKGSRFDLKHARNTAIFREVAGEAFPKKEERKNRERESLGTPRVKIVSGKNRGDSD